MTICKHDTKHKLHMIHNKLMVVVITQTFVIYPADMNYLLVIHSL